MTIKQGFLFLFLAITGWISLCYITDIAFPKKPVKQLMWYGEIHWDLPEIIYPEGWMYGDERDNPPKQEEPSEEKGAE